MVWSVFPGYGILLVCHKSDLILDNFLLFLMGNIELIKSVYITHLLSSPFCISVIAVFSFHSLVPGVGCLLLHACILLVRFWKQLYIFLCLLCVCCLVSLVFLVNLCYLVIINLCTTYYTKIWFSNLLSSLNFGSQLVNTFLPFNLLSSVIPKNWVLSLNYDFYWSFISLSSLILLTN